MFIVIVTDALADFGPLVLENDETEVPATFSCIAEIRELKNNHMLTACDWWAFDCNNGETHLIDAQNEGHQQMKLSEMQSGEPFGSAEYRHCNHHHELTSDHVLVDFGDGEFVANRVAVPLLKALNEAGIRTRTHHYDGGEHGFVGLLMDNVTIEVRQVNEIHADRNRYDGKMELLIRWQNPATAHKGKT